MRDLNRLDRLDEVITILSCLKDVTTLLPYKGFPNSVVTELLFSVRFVFPPDELKSAFFILINKGYNPFNFPKNSKEYIQVRNIVKLIDHAEEKKNK